MNKYLIAIMAIIVVVLGAISYSAFNDAADHANNIIDNQTTPVPTQTYPPINGIPTPTETPNFPVKENKQ